MLRVICPYEPQIHPLCDRALPEGVERVRLGGETTAYWELLNGLWAAGEPFAIVEHDIELRGCEIDGFLTCPEPWCSYPYDGPGAGQGGDPLLYGSLGCVRFSRSLLRERPDAFGRVGRVSNREDLCRRDWRGIDVQLFDLLRGDGYQVHTHWPKVLQHHVYAGHCSCGTDHEDIPVNRDGRYQGWTH